MQYTNGLVCAKSWWSDEEESVTQIEAEAPFEMCQARLGAQKGPMRLAYCPVPSQAMGPECFPSLGSPLVREVCVPANWAPGYRYKIQPRPQIFHDAGC